MKLADIKKEIEAKAEAIDKSKAAYGSKILKLNEDADAAAKAATAAAASEDDAAYIKAMSDKRAALDLIALYSDKLNKLNGGMTEEEIKAEAEKIKGAIDAEKAAFYPGIIKSVRTLYESVDSFSGKIEEANRLWGLVNEINGKATPYTLVDAFKNYSLRNELNRVMLMLENIE